MRKQLSTAKINVVKKREVETWIYSYADLITNLLALFLMMLIVRTGSGKIKVDFIKGLEEYTAAKASGTDPQETVESERERIHQLLAAVIQKSPYAGQVNLQKSRTGIELAFDGAIVFDSGTAALSEEAKSILAPIVSFVRKLPRRYIILVEGHSDSRPVKSDLYPSNWELSAARAAAVVRYFEAMGFPSQRLRAVALAATHPLASRREEEALNRRVLIKIDETATIEKIQ